MLVVRIGNPRFCQAASVFDLIVVNMSPTMARFCWENRESGQEMWLCWGPREPDEFEWVAVLTNHE